MQCIPTDPRTSAMRVITPDGRFNYNRSFNIDTLPKINGVPVISDMDLETIGVKASTVDRVLDIVKGCWVRFGF